MARAENNLAAKSPQYLFANERPGAKAAQPESHTWSPPPPQISARILKSRVPPIPGVPIGQKIFRTYPGGVSLTFSAFPLRIRESHLWFSLEVPMGPAKSETLAI